MALALGPLPAGEALAALDALLPERAYPGDLMLRALLLAMLDRAEVLEVADRRDEAVAAWQEALSLYERKGVIPLARRVRERLASVEAS